LPGQVPRLEKTLKVALGGTTLKDPLGAYRTMALRVEDWGLEVGAERDLVVDGCSALELAAEYGTPLHVVHEARLRETVASYIRAFRERYAGDVEPFYAMKCNGVPGVVSMVFQSGAKPEVMSEYEYWLARRLGVPPAEIIVNGPHKGKRFLRALVSEGVKFVVVDSLQELDVLGQVCSELDRPANLLLRLNPDYTPYGMNPATATASRKGAIFGLDLASGEERTALALCRQSRLLRYQGLHVHIGTGCKRAEDYSRAFARFSSVLQVAESEYGLETGYLNFGGGFGSATAREYKTGEFLLYLGFGRLPPPPRTVDQSGFAQFADHICGPVEAFCRQHGHSLPRLILEPGRSLISSNILFLMSVRVLKPAGKRSTWAVTDGGMWTTTFNPTFEYHEIFVCRDVLADRTRKYNITGSAFYGGDYIVHNKRLPPLREGDVLALMDAGAYFTAMESNFGRPRPPYVAVKQGRARVLRRPERSEDMLSRDVL
jgi:diaminopimelate decarboxylase